MSHNYPRAPVRERHGEPVLRSWAQPSPFSSRFGGLCPARDPRDSRLLFPWIRCFPSLFLYSVHQYFSVLTADFTKCSACEQPGNENAQPADLGAGPDITLGPAAAVTSTLVSFLETDTNGRAPFRKLNRKCSAFFSKHEHIQ